MLSVKHREGSFGMYEIVRRTGSFTEKLTGSPTFTSRQEAESWASDFIQSHPDHFRVGLQGIEVRRIILAPKETGLA
jgi:hypothetical protein